MKMTQHIQAHQNILNQQQGSSGLSGMLGTAAQQATGFLAGAGGAGGAGGALMGLGAMKPVQSTWDAFLAGRNPTAELGLKFLKSSPDGFWAEPLNLVLGECLDRIKKLEDSNPWQKSYDQIADEKEAKNGA